MAPRNPDGLDVGGRVLGRERERMHTVFVHGTRAERATRRVFVDEDRPFTERAVALSHRGRVVDLIRHRVSRARGERSPPSSDECRRSLNAAAAPDAAKPSDGGLRPWLRSRSGGRPTLALAARDVRVNRFVLPAVVPLVVDRELRLAARGGADPSRPEHLVRPRERPDRCAPEPLLCHVRSLPFGKSRVAGPSALNSSFERQSYPVHS
jgi:hypothetical protein